MKASIRKFMALAVIPASCIAMAGCESSSPVPPSYEDLSDAAHSKAAQEENLKDDIVWKTDGFSKNADGFKETGSVKSGCRMVSHPMWIHSGNSRILVNNATQSCDSDSDYTIIYDSDGNVSSIDIK